MIISKAKLQHFLYYRSTSSSTSSREPGLSLGTNLLLGLSHESCRSISQRGSL